MSSRGKLHLASLLVAALLVAPMSADSRQAAAAGPQDVLSKAAHYLNDYREQLTYVMATERYTQKLTGGYSQYDMEEELASDVYFVYVPADNVWMAIRDVEIVDGKVLKERENVRAILNSGTMGAARALKDKNARYNLGTIVRNFNEPTLSLLLLDAGHRSKINILQSKTSGTRTTVSCIEVAGPTLITNVDGTPAYARGEFVLDTATGRVERAELHVRLGIVDAVLTTTYKIDGKLKMWVPSRFEESYLEDGRRPQRISGRADYTDYTRFDVEVRIKTPHP